MSSGLDAAGRPHVTAIVVSHNGARWLPQLIAALEASVLFPDQLVAVDTGSSDSSRSILLDALGDEAVVGAPSATGFGAAVQIGLDSVSQQAPAATGRDNEWLWLLHDDCSPAPDALSRLLEVGAADNSIAAVGCRVRAWPRARRLLEVGVTISGSGHRETGLEPGEYDQGQHDTVRDVLAVSSAGMLVRRRPWEQLGGFDARLPLFRDDVDFGWRLAKAGHRVVVAPPAIVFHAEAATRGVRPIANTHPSPHRADRRAALHTMLANCSLLFLPLQYLRLLLGSFLRALGYLLGKVPSAALDEVAAMVSVLGRPHRIVAARLRRRGHSRAPRSAVRRLLPPWWTPYAHGVESIMGTVSEGVRGTATTVASSARRLRSGRGDATELETGPVPEEAVNLPASAGPLPWVRTHPLLCLSGVLTLVALVASRGLWGGGLLQGGALPPASDTAVQWWRLYGESWHPVRTGSDDAASPYVALLAVVGTILAAKAWLVVDLLVLLAVPLAALGAYAVAGRLVASQGVRLWTAASYALLPVLGGATTSGHVGTVAGLVLLPWLVGSAHRLLAEPDAGLGWRPAFAVGLWLAAVTAFVPVAWPMAAALALMAAVWLLVSHRGVVVIPRLLSAVVLPLLALVPWSLRLLADPSLFLTEAGIIDPALPPAAADAWLLPVGRLDVAGAAPWWLTLGVLLGAVAALLRTDRRRGVATCWVVIMTALGAAALLARTTVTVPGGFGEAFVWVGFPVLVAQAAAICAAGLAADGVTGFIASERFGWRQPVAAVTAFLAVLAPLGGLVWWLVEAPHGDLAREAATPLPAYMLDALGDDSTARVLLLTGDARRVEYDVVAGDGLRLGDDSVLPAEERTDLTDLVTDVLAEGTVSDTSRLAGFGIRYVVVPSPTDPDLVAAFDGLPGVSRASTDVADLAGWRVDAPARDALELEPENDSRREAWLVLQLVVVVVSLVLAAPGLAPRQGISEELR